jgi:hypothetical protein
MPVWGRAGQGGNEAGDVSIPTVAESTTCRKAVIPVRKLAGS